MTNVVTCPDGPQPANLRPAPALILDDGGFYHLVKSPVLFSIIAVFAGVWVFSVNDRSAAANLERALFRNQLVTCETGMQGPPQAGH
jgi:hypothetical protein